LTDEQRKDATQVRDFTMGVKLFGVLGPDHEKEMSRQYSKESLLADHFYKFRRTDQSPGGKHATKAHSATSGRYGICVIFVYG
jgi:hypothetical protein